MKRYALFLWSSWIRKAPKTFPMSRVMTMPSTWIGAGDPLYAGAFNITAAGTSYEVDVTSVAKEAARTTGKLALHVYGAWWREQSEWDILQGPGSTVAEQRPQMIAEWADSSRSPAIPDATETLELEPTDDMYQLWEVKGVQGTV